MTAEVGLDLTVRAGQVVGLIGPNGAARTSFIDAISGFTLSGMLSVCQQDISGYRPHRRARAGLRRTWQPLELFDDLTVHENLRVSLGKPHPARVTHGRGKQLDAGPWFASEFARERVPTLAEW